MMKNKIRLTALDIMALVTELKQKLIGTRLSNIYNIDQKTYVFKFSLQESKSYLVVENGLRFNLSDTIEKNKVPSGFTMKFRKFLRSRRLEQIEQIGVERVVVFTFGREDHTYYLILELYSQGNIILADKDYRIIQLTRQHQFSEEVKVAPNEIYPFEYTATNYLEKFDTSLERIQKVVTDKPGQKFKEVLFKLVPCLHQSLTDDMIQLLQFNPNEKITNQFENVQKVVDHAMAYIKNFKAKNQYSGYLCAKEAPQNDQKPKFFDFAPDQANYFQGKYVVETPTFNEAVHQYFSVVDRQEENKQTIEDIAWKKFENIKQDQMGRIQKLQTEQDEYIIKAGLIQDNINDVQAIIDIIQKMIDGGIPWDKIQRMINDSKKEGNPLSNLIGGMNLKQNKVTILLGDNSDEYAELLQIEIDITLSAHQNARKYFENKKKNREKEIKTREAVEQALKQAEKTALKEIEREKNKIQKVQNQRKKYWFEKFYWFISSDGYLVISGRDVQQNEMIVKKYMNKDDVYMHADIHGSASTIIKNPNNATIIPDSTLMQAATATICRSKAWDAKIVVSAWWVYASQVSKGAPTGMNIPAGSFMIYGKKNFVYPPRLEMGCTLLYQLDQESIKRHEEERMRKLKEEQSVVDEQEQNESEITEKNILDSDNDDSPNEQQEPIQLEQTNSVQTIKEGENEYTIVEVNPNARIIQQRNDKKQKEKETQQQQQQKQQQQANKPKQGKQQVQPVTKQVEQPQKVTKNEEESDEDDLKNKKTQQVRGKKNKMKKVKQKYADQDDDERELRQKLMGATYMKNEAKPEKKEQQNAPEKQEEPKVYDKEYYKNPKKQELITHKLLKQQGIEVVEEKEVEQQKTEPIQQEVVVEKQEIKQEQAPKQEEEEIPTTKQEEPDSDDEKQEKVQEEEDNIEYTEMQKLVSYLYADDQYISLIPMVAPYQVLGNNKFKIKMAPGSLKKGKAGKEILNFFSINREITNQERQLLKMITDEEIVQSMLSGVKLTGVGMLQMKQKEKQLKKQQPKKNK